MRGTNRKPRLSSSFQSEGEKPMIKISVTQGEQRKETSFEKGIEMEEDEGPSKVDGEVWSGDERSA